MCANGAAALDYAARGWPVFPCRPGSKRPLVDRGFHDASTVPETIGGWWWRWPAALIGMPTGEPSGVVVLDIDVKRPEAHGFDTLDVLGFGVLPDAPMAHTPSGGLHIYFRRPGGGLRNTCGERGRGVGPGLDWRGDGGYIIAPSPDGGYSWDPHWNLDSALLAEVPDSLFPRSPAQPQSVTAIRPTIGLSPYAEAALDSACRQIIGAPAGEQEQTLNGEAFAIGTLAGAGGIPADFARRALLWAAHQMASYDARRPWHPVELARKVERAFAEGLRHPRAEAA